MIALTAATPHATHHGITVNCAGSLSLLICTSRRICIQRCICCQQVQTYVYYTLFPKDSWKLRILVASEMLFQTVHLTLLVVGVWTTVATDYSQRPQVLGLAPTITLGVLFSAPIPFCTQAYFVSRLYTFSHKKALLIFCSFLVITQFVFTLIISISTVAANGLSLQSWQWNIISTLFITICADAVIAMSMSYYLKTSDPGFHRTTRVVDRMVLYIMVTGIIPSISALASAILFLIVPYAYVWLGLFVIESGIYTNSLLAAYVLGILLHSTLYPY
ncbi:hypothetical protein EDD16DRAFT_930226 [Pisolithus croceorrhizus]|nr:hypothetical protein EDD16DRAFT_930226 [Pisolithus croceorrhizus]